MLKVHIWASFTINCLKSTSTFTSKTAHNNHLKTVHSDLRPYFCQTFGDAFKMKRTLDTHLDNKHSVVNHECLKYEQLFKSKNSLDYHYKTHDIENRFPCEACGKRFVTKTKLKMHMNIHT